MDVQTIRTAPPSRFEWTEAKEIAAAMVALDEVSDVQIAATVGIDRNTLWWWKKSPVFSERVKEHLTEIREKIMEEGIAVKANRVRALNDRHRRLTQVIAERATHFANHEDPDVREIPGATTGLLVRHVRMIGSGRTAREIEEYIVDTATLREVRSVEEHAAREVGQWTDKPAVQFAQKLYIGINLDDDV